MKLLSLFSGIGAFEKAFDNIEKEYELVGFSEIDKFAVKSYCAIHGVDESMNLGDITKIDEKALPKNIDLVTYGFPCQDISLAGKQKGLFNDDGTQTRSGLFFEALRIIEATHPRVAIAENVKNLTSKRFAEQFKIVLEALEQAGYNNYWKVLNAKDYGVPQNRERVFIVSVRKDVDTGLFQFPEGFPLEFRLKDILEDEVDEKYYMSEKSISYICETGTKNFYYEPEIDLEIARPLTSTMHKSHRASQDNYVSEAFVKEGIKATIQDVKTFIFVKQATKKGYVEAAEGDSINFEQPNSKTRRGMVGHGVAQTLTTQPQQAVVQKIGCVNSSQDGVVVSPKWISPTHTAGHGNAPKIIDDLRIRKLTPKECFRLMGFEDADFEKAQQVNSNTQLYKQAGNSIVVPVIEYIIKSLIDCGALLKEREEEEMELKIYSPTEDGFIKKIDWNNEEIKKWVAESVEHYKGLVYTDAQIQDAKKDCANLRKFIGALESKRKEVKKQCLAPYEQFEREEKEIVAIVNEPIALIDKQIKEYEQIKRDEKLKKVQEIFAEVDFPEWVSFEKVYDTKWLNTSVSLKSIKGAMEVMKEKIAKDLETLHILPEFAFEAEQLYISTLDIQKAITEANRMAEMQKAKAAHEAEQARRKAEDETRKAAEAQKQQDEQLEGQIGFTDAKSFEECMNPLVEEKPEELKRQWIAFKANLTTADAFALKEFFDNRNIEFKPL